MNQTHCPPEKAFGLTLVEVLVAIVILAVISAAIVGLLPGLTRTSIAANDDIEETQVVMSAFERIAEAWRDEAAYENERVDGQPVADYVAAQTTRCAYGPPVDHAWGRIVTITCPAVGALPERVLVRAYGDPR